MSAKVTNPATSSITLLAARPNLHSLKDRPPATEPQQQALGQPGPRPGYLSPHLPRASTERQLATQPSEVSAFASTSRLTRTSTPPSAAYSYTQLGPTNPSPTHGRSSATHGQPYSISASPGPLPPPPIYPPPPSLRPPSFQAQTYPIIDPNTAIPPPLPRSQLRPRSPLFSFYHLASTHTSKRTSTGTTPVANSIRSQILSEIQNIGTGGGSTPHPSTSLFRTNIPLNHPLKPLLEASLNSILQAVSQGPSSHTWQHGKASKLFTPLITCHSPPFHYGHHHSSPTPT